MIPGISWSLEEYRFGFEPEGTTPLAAIEGIRIHDLRIKDNGPSRYRPDIDGLRAIAVVLVVVYHACAAWLPGGFVGVDVFFVVSGYLITGILVDAMRDESFTFAWFYRRRVLRILPALVVVVAAALALGWLVLLPDAYAALGKLSIAAGLVSNFTLARESGYFDVSTELQPLRHLWSLGVEEQFYAVWPALLFVIPRRRRVSVVGGILLLALAASVAMTFHSPAFAFFMLPARFWQLMAGAWLATSERAGYMLPTRLHAPAALVGTALVGASVVLIDGETRYPGLAAIAPTLGAALLVAAPASMLNRRVLSWRPFVWLGLVSYPLYLWHWPLFVFARVLTGRNLAAPVSLPLVAVAVLLSWATLRLVEQPIRFGAYAKRPGTAVVLVVALAIVGVGGAVVWRGRGLPSVRGFADAPLAQLSEAAFEANRRTYPPCPARYAPFADLSWCIRARDAAPTAALVGDSHADALFPGLASVDPARNWLLIGESSCPPFLDVAVHLRSEGDVCRAMNARAIAGIADDPDVRVVVLAWLAPYYETDHGVTPQHVGKIDPANIVVEVDGHPELVDRAAKLAWALERTLRVFEEHGKRVVVLIDVPALPFMPEACLERPLTRLLGGQTSTPCAVGRDDVAETQAATRDIVARATAAHPGVTVFDAAQVLCTGGTCRVLDDDGTPLYRDSHHLSRRGAVVVGRALVDALR